VFTFGSDRIRSPASPRPCKSVALAERAPGLYGMKMTDPAGGKLTGAAAGRVRRGLGQAAGTTPARASAEGAPEPGTERLHGLDHGSPPASWPPLADRPGTHPSRGRYTPTSPTCVRLRTNHGRYFVSPSDTCSSPDRPPRETRQAPPGEPIMSASRPDVQAAKAVACPRRAKALAIAPGSRTTHTGDAGAASRDKCRSTERGIGRGDSWAC
jgi:hypothetical protein